MSKSGTLYTFPDSFQAYKALISANYSGAKVNTCSAVSSLSEEFLKKFPLGKVPAFESSSGECYFGSNAISYYLSDQKLRGEDEVSQTLIYQWISFSDSEILPNMAACVYPTLGLLPNNKHDIEVGRNQLFKCLDILNSHLRSRTYFVGERITSADISVACSLLPAFKQILDSTARNSFPYVTRWFTTFVNQPNVISVIGDIQPCCTPASFDAKTYAQLHPKSGHSHDKQKHRREEKPREKEEKPKEKEECPMIEPTASKAEDAEPAKINPRDPLEDMKVDFPFDAFKRCYSNEDTSVAIEYFWEHFEKSKDKLSIWRSSYNYPEELGQIFMSCNLVSGMMQRVEKMRKHSFGSICIFGEDKHNQISGLWFWKGQELIFDLCEDWNIDAPSYSWTKLDPDCAETKEQVQEYFMWEFQKHHPEGYNKECQDGKIFK